MDANADQDTVYVVIRGLRTCTDCDSLYGYVHSEAEAIEHCKRLNATESDASFSFDWEAIDLLKLPTTVGE